MSATNGYHLNGGGDVRLVDVDNDFERCFHTVILNCAVLEGLEVGFSREAQNIERVVASQSDQLSALRPVYLNAPVRPTSDSLNRTTHVVRQHINPSHQSASLPVEESDTTRAAYAQQHTTHQTLRGKTDI